MGKDSQSPQPPGWYPDPVDPDSEIYWDGSAWVNQRRPVGAASGSATAGLQSAGTGIKATWQRAGRGQRVAMASFSAAVVIGLLMGMVKCSSDYGTRNDCEKYVDSQGLAGPGSVRDSLVEHCIFMHNEFGAPIR